MSWLSIFTYNVDALLVLFWSIALFIGTWDIKVNASTKKAMSIVFKTSAVVLPIGMCVACSTDTVQRVPVAYLVAYNFLMATCLTTGSLLVVIVLLKYLQSRNVFTRFFPKSTTMSTSLGGRTMSSVATTRTTTGTDKWLIVRFSIIMICLLVFETAQIIYQIVNYERNRHPSRTTAESPNFSAEQAKIDISQDIPGTLPSIIAFLIFGTTAPFRRKYARIIRVICCCSPRQRARSRKDPVPWMMLQPRPQGEASCASFPDDCELGAQNKPKNGIRVRTEITTSSVSSSITAAENPSDGKDRPVTKEDVRRVSFGGTTVRSEEEPATPPSAHSNPNSRRPSSPSRWHSRTLSPIILPVSYPPTPSGQPFGSWDWSSHSRQTSLSQSHQESISHGAHASISNSQKPTASPSRQASISSAHSQRSFSNPPWTAPASPPRPRALPLVPELDTDSSATTAMHRRTPSSPRSPRSSKDDPLYQRPMSSPRQTDAPPVPRIPEPSEWRRDSTATIASAQILTEISRGSGMSQTALNPSREWADAGESGMQGQGRGGHPSWLTESARASYDSFSATSNRGSGDGLVPTATARSGTITINLASAHDHLGPPRASGERNNASRTSEAQRQRQGSGSQDSTPRGSPNPAAVTPPSHQSPGGWI